MKLTFGIFKFYEESITTEIGVCNLRKRAAVFFPLLFPTIVRAEMTMPLQYSATVVFKDDRRKLCMLGCISAFQLFIRFGFFVTMFAFYS